MSGVSSRSASSSARRSTVACSARTRSAARRRGTSRVGTLSAGIGKAFANAGASSARPPATGRSGRRVSPALAATRPRDLFGTARQHDGGRFRLGDGRNGIAGRGLAHREISPARQRLANLVGLVGNDENRTRQRHGRYAALQNSAGNLPAPRKGRVNAVGTVFPSGIKRPMPAVTICGRGMPQPAMGWRHAPAARRRSRRGRRRRPQAGARRACRAAPRASSRPRSRRSDPARRAARSGSRRR